MRQTMRRVSLSAELMTIRDAIGAVRLLVHPLLFLPLGECGVPRGLPRAVIAGLTLVEERLRHVDRAICGVIDPRTIATAENEPGRPDDGSTDVILLPWSPKRRARQELRGAKRLRKNRSTMKGEK
jgi:hypothetical protein